MYESFYGLKEKPFTLLPDPEYLYLSPKHQRALTLLVYGMMHQAGFSVICGDIGAGNKSVKRIRDIAGRYPRAPGPRLIHPHIHLENPVLPVLHHIDDPGYFIEGFQDMYGLFAQDIERRSA